MNQFNVATNARYTPYSSVLDPDTNKKVFWSKTYSATTTFCNIFVWDVTIAMKCEIPNVLKDDKGNVLAYLRANDMYDYLKSKRVVDVYGGYVSVKHNWYEIDGTQAQQRANDGYPTVASWKNTDTKKYKTDCGHIAMIRPVDSTKTNSTPVIAQAGSSNYMYGSVTDAFTDDKMTDGYFAYFTHD